jgi:hypothetical protein
MLSINLIVVRRYFNGQENTDIGVAVRNWGWSKSHQKCRKNHNAEIPNKSPLTL